MRGSALSALAMFGCSTCLVELLSTRHKRGRRALTPGPWHRVKATRPGARGRVPVLPTSEAATRRVEARTGRLTTRRTDLLMANENPTGLGVAKCLTTFDEDEREQAALLRLVLELHPATFTRGELIRELTGGGSGKFTDIDGAERAIRDLVSSGLLHHPGEDGIVRPTRAAVRYFDLTGGAA